MTEIVVVSGKIEEVRGKFVVVAELVVAAAV